MIIRQATPDEYEDVRAFLRDSIDKGELYIAKDDVIIGSMIVNHECNEGYREFDWPTKAEDPEILLIHALGVHPSYSGKGIAKKMVRFVIEKAEADGMKTIRLDVLKGNLPAEKLYSGLGFTYLHTLKMFYEDTGWTDYELYEYALASGRKNSQHC